MLVSHVVHVLMSAQWVQFLKVTFTQLTLICAQSAALVLMFAQVKQFHKDNLQLFAKQRALKQLLRGSFCCALCIILSGESDYFTSIPMTL